MVSISFRTIAVKVGDAGQPYEKPSFTVITVQDPSSNLTNVSPGPSYSRSLKVSRSREGKLKVV